MNRAETVRWLRSEMGTLENISTRVARAAEAADPAGITAFDTIRQSRRHRETLYRLTDQVDRAYDAALAALDTIDPHWDDPQERPPGTPANCTGTEWLRDGMCDDGGEGGRCPVHATDPEAATDEPIARVGDPFARTFGYDGEETGETLGGDTRAYIVTVHDYDDPIPETLAGTLKALYDEAYRGATRP